MTVRMEYEGQFNEYERFFCIFLESFFFPFSKFMDILKKRMVCSNSNSWLKEQTVNKRMSTFMLKKRRLSSFAAQS